MERSTKGIADVNATSQVKPAENVPVQPAEVATVYPDAVVVAVTAYWSFTTRIAELVPFPVDIIVDVDKAKSDTLIVDVAPDWRPLTIMASVLVEDLPPQLVHVWLATMIVDVAVLLARSGSVEDEEDETTDAVFVIGVPAEAVTSAWISSVALELGAIVPIVHTPVEEA